MAQTDKRRRSEAQRKKTKDARLARADIARRKRRWQASQEAATNAGYPINAHITIVTSDDLAAITTTVWRKLLRMMRKYNSPFIAVRAPEYARQKRHHLHIALHLDPANYNEVTAILTQATSEEIGGWGIDPSGRKLGSNLGVVASSVRGNWMLQRHIDTLNGSSDTLVEYVAKGCGKRKAIGQHERSQDLLKMTKAHQECPSEPLRAPPEPNSMLMADNVSKAKPDTVRALTVSLRDFDNFSEGFNHA